MSGVTNDLVALVEAIGRQEESVAEALVEKLETRHRAVLAECAQGPHLQEGTARLEALFTDLKALVKGSLLLNECSPRVHDAVLGMGELWSTSILFSRCRQRGIDAELLDSRRLVVTDEKFGEAAVLHQATRDKIRAGVRQVGDGFEDPGHQPVILPEVLAHETQDGHLGFDLHRPQILEILHQDRQIPLVATRSTLTWCRSKISKILRRNP